MEKIISILNGFSKYESIFIICIHLVLIIALVLLSLYFFKYLSVHKVLEKFIARIKNDIHTQERLKNEEYQKQFELEGATEDKKDTYKKTSRMLNDSGLKTRIPEITPVSFYIIVGIICIAVFSLGMILTKSFVVAIVLAAASIVAIKFYIELLIAQNYRQMEKEAIKFINLLRNNSHIDGSIGEMLGRTIPYISGNLKLSIEKCYYEIKSTGNVITSIEHLCERTSYRKLREVFDALKMCATHNEDYEQVIDEAASSLSSYIEYRGEVATIKKSNLIDLLVIAVAGFVIVFEMRGLLTDIDTTHYMFHTVIGQALCAGMVGITLLGVYRFIKNEED